MDTETPAHLSSLPRRPSLPSAPRRSGVAVLLALVAFLPPNTAGAESSCARSGRNRILAVATRSYLPAGARLVEIRTVSAGCLGCHDGTAGSNVLSDTRPQPVSLTLLDMGRGDDEGALGANHPVDVLYPLSSDSFVPRGQIDPRLVLDDGRITCRTCHPSSANDLALPLARSELCLACHLK